MNGYAKLEIQSFRKVGAKPKVKVSHGSKTLMQRNTIWPLVAPEGKSFRITLPTMSLKTSFTKSLWIKITDGKNTYCIKDGGKRISDVETIVQQRENLLISLSSNLLAEGALPQSVDLDKKLKGKQDRQVRKQQAKVDQFSGEEDQSNVPLPWKHRE